MSSIPAEHAVRGVHSVTLSEASLDVTSAMLTERLSMLTGRLGGP